MTAISAAKEHDPKTKARSKVSNGGAGALPGVSGRSERARRYRDLCNSIAMDQGGIDALSEARVQLIRRFAATCIACEEAEAAMARGDEVDMQEFLAMASTLVRLAGRIGIGRHAKNITPDLETYMATSYALNPEKPEKPEP